jgi:Domain of unknown function (DUF5615)
VKLCLDEHYAKRIAELLRERGREVDCVKERADLVSLRDGALWEQMQQEHRALLTQNVADFMPLITRTSETGESHWGIIFSNSRSMPRGSATIGVFVESIDRVMQEFAGEDEFRDRVDWLHP